MSTFEDALKLHQQGAISDALKIYHSILKQSPQHSDAQHLLGVSYFQLGKLQRAQTEIKKAISINNKIADYWINLSNVQKSTGEISQALESLQSALTLQPDHAQAWNNFGNLQQLGEQHNKAINSYKKALSLEPNYATAHYNLSISLGKTTQLSEAIKHSKTALELEPGKVEGWGQLGVFLVRTGKQDQAKSIIVQGLKIHRNSPELLSALASLIEEDGELNKALEIYTQILKNHPADSLAISQLLYLKRSVCDWIDLDRRYQKLIQAIKQQQPYISPFSFLTEKSTPQQQLECAALWAKQWASLPTPQKSPVRSNRNPKKITLGYVSADFYQHPTAYLTARLFEQHHRQQFKVIAFSNSREDDSDISRRLKRSFDEFIDIKTLSVAATVALIKKHKVDILIDLKGYTMEAATEIFAHRAAPVQVNYLGFPGTMGAPFMDYIIGDKFVTPIEDEKYFSEKIVQLNNCYQINDNQRPLPENIHSKKQLGLPENQFVFGCFNNSWKITPETFKQWMEILKRCPNSVLWLMDRHPKTDFKNNILKQAAADGVDSARILFAKTASYENYLSYYFQMDLFLETVPYNAHTMASDALWMGCPVLSVKGETFCARVGESILDAVDLTTELFCDSFETFIERAESIYASPEQLSRLKQYLNKERHQLPLFDSSRTVLSIEQAYIEMFRRVNHKENPAHIIIS